MSPAAFLNRIRRPAQHRGTPLAPALLALALLLALLVGPRPADAQILEVWPAHTSPGLPTYFALITDGRYSQVELHYPIGGAEQTVLLPTDACDGPGGACSLSHTLPATADLGTACFKRSGDSPDTPCAPFAVVAGPAVDPIPFYVTSPQFNRPPATYRFAPNSPVLAPGERVSGDPTWTVDGQPAGTSAALYDTFSTPGAHTVSVTAPTRLPRLISGDTALVIAANQPPTAPIDRSRSFLDRSGVTPTYLLSCKAVNASDPEGRIRSLRWTPPQAPYERAGTTLLTKGFTAPQLVQVHLLLTDDSGATTTLERTVALATLR